MIQVEVVSSIEDVTGAIKMTIKVYNDTNPEEFITESEVYYSQMVQQFTENPTFLEEYKIERGKHFVQRFEDWQKAKQLATDFIGIIYSV